MPTVELTLGELDQLIASLGYALREMDKAGGVGPELYRQKRERMEPVEALQAKLRAAKRADSK